MSDPFGEDTTDFDTRKLCHDAYNEAVAHLRAERVHREAEDDREAAILLPPMMPPKRANFDNKLGRWTGSTYSLPLPSTLPVPQPALV